MPIDCHPCRTTNLHLAYNQFMEIVCKVTNHTTKSTGAGVQVEWLSFLHNPLNKPFVLNVKN